jgi:hypothetical protein
VIRSLEREASDNAIVWERLEALKLYRKLLEVGPRVAWWWWAAGREHHG